MKHVSTIAIAIAALLLLTPATVAQHAHQAHGEVDFPTSCTDEAQAHFDTGLALLHHMMYDQAEAHFQQAADADPECAMAYWGVAMTVIHPLWGERPSDEALARGRAALETAHTLAPATKREQAYVEALDGFYADAGAPYADQLKAFADGFADLHEAYPDEIDAAAFYALGQLATAPQGDKTFSRQAQAGALLEDLHKRAPNHPGLFHYIIHAYDNPVLAERAIEVARGYDSLAPDVPHALHMPSHIFVRLGIWPDAVDWNRRSAEAALRQSSNDVTSMHYAHAIDYMVYGYLQQGMDAEAQRVAEEMISVERIEPTFAAAYALAASQARPALETGRWDLAAKVEPRTPSTIPWERYPGAESISHFARGIGAARAGDLDSAREALQAIDALYEQMTAAGDGYWSVHADAQRKAVAAWIALEEGDRKQALELMHQAADVEESVDKHPVTPGAVLPARELLGDMLLIAEMPDEAKAAYERSLAISPNRLNALYGAGRAAELAGASEDARSYYGKVIEVAGKGDAGREAVARARAAVED